MKRMPIGFLVLTGALLLCFGAADIAAANVCFDCHEAGNFSGKVIHAPTAEGKCGSCHNPHVARHDGLLRQAQQNLCFSCHERMQGELSRSAVVHDPVMNGDCASCHNPHASSQRDLVRGKGAEVCFSCHEALKSGPPQKHDPFAKGNCGVCHDSHSSSLRNLATESDPKMCLKCHKNSLTLSKKHLGRDLQQIACLKCHNPHGSENQAFLRTVRHAPFADADCNVCHGQADMESVCLSCHEDVMSSFNGIRSHLQQAANGNPCSNCHTPHAADRPGLLPGRNGQVCESCHADTFERRELSLHKHPDWGQCSTCHELHGSNQLAMLKHGEDAVCGQCHERHAQFTHPLGEKALDVRNGRPMTCLTCHDSNTGTMYKFHLRGSSDKGLCVGCHKGY